MENMEKGVGCGKCARNVPPVSLRSGRWKNGSKTEKYTCQEGAWEA